MEESSSSFRKPNKGWLVRGAKIANYIMCILMLLNVIFRLFHFPKAKDPFYYLLTFYQIGFAILLAFVEADVRKVIKYIEFLASRIGKGVFLCFTGLLIFDQQFGSDIFVGLVVFFVGIFNIIVGCIRRKDEPEYIPYIEGQSDQEHQQEEVKESYREETNTKSERYEKEETQTKKTEKPNKSQKEKNKQN